MKDPQGELSAALYTLLTGAGITWNSTSVPVYTVVDDNATYPYIYLKPNQTQDQGVKDSYVSRNQSTIEVCVGYKKRGSRTQADSIMNQVAEALPSGVTLSMTNFVNCLTRIENISYREELTETGRLLIKQLDILNILEEN